VVFSPKTLSVAATEKSKSWRPSIGINPNATPKADESDQDKDLDVETLNQIRDADNSPGTQTGK
jgi:hypothetical protein